MPLKWQEKPLPSLVEGERHSIFTIAHKFFPTSFLIKAVGVSFTSFLFIYRYLVDHEIGTFVTRVLLTTGLVVVVPAIVLYIITLARAPRMRRQEEQEAAERREVAHGNLKTLQAKEQKEEREIVRLQEVATGNAEAQHVKDLKEDDRWEVLNESLRLQNQTIELASEERLLVAQQVKDIKDEGEVIRKGLVSDDLEARHVKDLKEDKRWDLLNETLRLQKETGKLASEERLLVAQQVKDVTDEREVVRIGLALDDLKARDVKNRKEDERWNLLNESLRIQKETVELASEERLIVAQQVKDIKDEGEVMRKGLVSDDLEARHIKEAKEVKRWAALDERLRIQEARSEEREKRQLLRDQEQDKIHLNNEIRETYRTLFARYIRNFSSDPSQRDVADGLAPIPEEWLLAQPEVIKDPELIKQLAAYNNQ